MRIVTKISLVTAAVAALASTALAGNEAHQNLLALERARMETSPRVESTTIAVYVDRRDAGGRADASVNYRSSEGIYHQTPEGRFVLRNNSHGGFYGVWEQAK